MTLYFKDPNGVEWQLWAWPLDGKFDARLAEPADLLAALGQLSPGSDGPSDEELRALFAQVLQAGGWTLEAVRASEVGGFRAIFNAGLALGEQKQAARVAELESLAYLGDHHFPDLTYKSRCDELQSELAATKAKLTEVERERDALIGLDRGAADYATLQEQIATHGASALVTVSRFEHNKLRSELASARRVVEAANSYVVLCEPTDGVDPSELDDYSRAEFELCVAVRALASAAPDADRTEADTRGPWPQVGSRVVINSSRPRFAGYRGEVIFAEGKSVRVRLDGNVCPDDDVWFSLENIGRELEPAAQLDAADSKSSEDEQRDDHDDRS